MLECLFCKFYLFDTLIKAGKRNWFFSNWNSKWNF